MRTLREIANDEIERYVRMDVKTFRQSDPVSKVLGEFDRTDHYEALVAEDGKTGLVTVRDLLSVIEPDKEIIGGYPNDRWTVYPEASLRNTVMEVVDVLIRNRVRALPVVEDSKALGIVCQVELMEALTEAKDFVGKPIKELIKMPVITMNASDGIAAGRKKMLDKGISHLPVLRDGKLVGIVTAKDLVMTFIKPIGVETTGERLGYKTTRFAGTLDSVMDDHPLIVNSEAPAGEVVNLMAKHGESACLILKNDFVVGIVTPRELLQAILGLKEEAELPVYIVGMPESVDFMNKADVENKITRVVERALLIHPHLSEFSVRIKDKRAKGGGRTMYQVNVNVYSKAKREQFNIQKEGWDLPAIFDKVGESLDKVLKDSKHKPRRLLEDQTKIRFARARRMHTK